MGYPYDKTYLEQIQENSYEKNTIRKAYWTLRKKYVADHPEIDDISLSIEEEFRLLGEAFKLESDVLDVSDVYHFMWDVLDALLPEDRVHQAEE